MGSGLVELLTIVDKLKKSKIKKQVDRRIKTFERLGNTGSCDDIFNELCFCILTANYNANRSIEIQKNVGNGFSRLPEKQLAQKLKKLGHRFPNTRAHYICEARKYKNLIFDSLLGKKERKNCIDEPRDWLVKNVKGLGYKEASHFLRNIGYKDYSIIDFHIIDLLVKYSVIEWSKRNIPKTPGKKRYLEIEKIMKRIAKKLELTLAELDLYLWYLETGKILK